MQSQKRAGEDNPFGSGQDEVKVKPSALQVPDVHEAMRLAGVKDVALSPKERQSDRRQRVICFCGDRSCGIGPFTQVVEE